MWMSCLLIFPVREVRRIMHIKTAALSIVLGASAALGIFPSLAYAPAMTPATEAICQAQLNDEAVLSLLWMQRSAEYKALCYQAYNALRRHVSEELEKPHDKPMAVILDIDETILDNTPFKARTVGTAIGKDKGAFSKWVAREEAKALAGASETLSWIDSKGVALFYVSDRAADRDLEATVANLKKAKIPVISSQVMLSRGDTKTERFQKIEERYDVIAYVGDNLLDFPIRAEGADMNRRDHFVKQNRELFGAAWIMLPNPDYGSWEYALCEGYKKLSAREKQRVRKEALLMINEEKEEVRQTAN